MHRRLSWLGSLEGFLFAALGFAWDKEGSLVVTISMLGLTVALLVFVATISTALAILSLQKYWNEQRPQDHQGPGVSGFFPTRAPLSVFISSEVLLPVAFAFAWGAVLWTRIATSMALQLI
ncbi:hypothetical protein AWB81_08587 [Caballeronia arationis]|nr:hypothetical protein AWB81_08587 [Caballeronia arationis]